MALPIRTTLDDIQGVCACLARKPRGATLAEMRQILDSKLLDGRKLAALRYWGFVTSDDGTYKITDLGRDFLKGNSGRRESLRTVISQIPEYSGVVERVLHRNEESITASEVGAHWHEHFQSEAGESDRILNDQAVCFFRVAEGAEFGLARIFHPLIVDWGSAMA